MDNSTNILLPINQDDTEYMVLLCNFLEDLIHYEFCTKRAEVACSEHPIARVLVPDSSLASEYGPCYSPSRWPSTGPPRSDMRQTGHCRSPVVKIPLITVFVAEVVSETPKGAFSRRIRFLYEWLTGREFLRLLWPLQSHSISVA